MNIRYVTEKDIPQLAEAYVSAFASIDPTEKWTFESAEKLLRFLFTTQPDLSFLVEDRGVIGGGILGIIKPWWDGNHLVETELFLQPSFQRSGIGTSLFRHFLTQAAQKYQVTVMEALTFKDLTFPLTWYQRLGFEAKDDWLVMFGNVGRILQGLKNGV